MTTTPLSESYQKCEFVAASPLENNLLGQKANACEDDGRLGGPVTLEALHPGVPAPVISPTMTMTMINKLPCNLVSSQFETQVVPSATSSTVAPKQDYL